MGWASWYLSSCQTMAHVCTLSRNRQSSSYGSRQFTVAFQLNDGIDLVPAWRKTPRSWANNAHMGLILVSTGHFQDSPSSRTALYCCYQMTTLPKQLDIPNPSFVDLPIDSDSQILLLVLRFGSLSFILVSVYRYLSFFCKRIF